MSKAKSWLALYWCADDQEMHVAKVAGSTHQEAYMRADDLEDDSGIRIIDWADLCGVFDETQVKNWLSVIRS